MEFLANFSLMPMLCPCLTSRRHQSLHWYRKHKIYLRLGFRNKMLKYVQLVSPFGVETRLMFLKSYVVHKSSYYCLHNVLTCVFGFVLEGPLYNDLFFFSFQQSVPNDFDVIGNFIFLEGLSSSDWMLLGKHLCNTQFVSTTYLRWSHNSWRALAF